jgi:hypothetical protein
VINDVVLADRIQLADAHLRWTIVISSRRLLALQHVSRFTRYGELCCYGLSYAEERDLERVNWSTQVRADSDLRTHMSSKVPTTNQVSNAPHSSGIWKHPRPRRSFSITTGTGKAETEFRPARHVIAWSLPSMLTPVVHHRQQMPRLARRFESHPQGCTPTKDPS